MGKKQTNTEGEIEGALRTYPRAGAIEYTRLRNALDKAGDTSPAALLIADEALSTWPVVDTF
jgi:hypothetical protein